MTFRISLFCSVALAVIPSVVQAADGEVEIEEDQDDIYVATNEVRGSSFDNFIATSETATFKKDLIGTRDKNVVNQTINFSGGTAGRDNISRTNTINISGGTIEGDILATEDSGNYKGSLR